MNKITYLSTLIFVATLTQSFTLFSAPPNITGSMKKIRKEVASVLRERRNLTKDCTFIGQEKIETLLRHVDKTLILESKKQNTDRILTNMLLAFGPTMLSYMIDMNDKQLVLLTPEAMPELNTLLSTLSDRLGIAVPHLFVCNDDDFINAAALSFTHDSAFIVVGKRLFEEMTIEELISTLGHELGHIKCNHMVKRTGAWLAATVALGCFGEYLYGTFISADAHETRTRSFLRHAAIWGASPLVSFHLLSPYYRHQENEADSIELSITHDPQALKNSLAKLHQLETKRIESYMNAHLKLTLYIDEVVGKKFPKQAELLKQNMHQPSMLSQLFHYLTDVHTHPDSHERGA